MSYPRLNARKLQTVSAGIQRLYCPVVKSGFARQVVDTFASILGSEIITYNEITRSEALVLSNNGFESEFAEMIKWVPPFLPQNPLINKALNSESIPGLRITDVMPAREFQRTQVYNEFYRIIGGDYQMGCAFPFQGPGTFWGIALNQKARDFTDTEKLIFNLLIPHAQQAYNICRSFDRAQVNATTFDSILTRYGTGAVCFDNAQRIVTVSAMARALAFKIFQVHLHEGKVLPEDLGLCFSHLKRADVSTLRNSIEYRLEDGSSITVRLVVDPEQANHCLIFEQSQGIPSKEHLQSIGLTSRESDVLHWILLSKTNWEIGTILGISSRTVEKHVEKLLGKFNVSQRHQMSSRVKELMGGRP